MTISSREPQRRGGDLPEGASGRREDSGSGLVAVRRALLYLRSYKGGAFGAFLALLLVSAASLSTPQLIRIAIDKGIAPRSLNVILLAVGGSRERLFCAGYSS